jgi:hypothetical protein
LSGGNPSPNPLGQAPSRSTGTQAGDFGLLLRSPSPSRHIYKSLTIAIAFRRLSAFDRVWQHLIKVDGTFA